MPPRYAVYYVPEAGSALDVLGGGLLGRNAAGNDVPRLWLKLPTPLRLEDITAAPRHYGLHATLKAPFEPARGRTQGQLREKLRAIARDYSALTLPPLMVDTVPDAQGRQGSFLALRPSISCDVLHSLAARCVRELDEFRAPLSPEDAARRTDLNPRQQDNLLRWGYPHVLEDFHFHITLTDSLPDAPLRQQVADVLRSVFMDVCTPQRVTMRGLTLMQQADRQSPFRLVASFPFKPLDQGLSQ